MLPAVPLRFFKPLRSLSLALGATLFLAASVSAQEAAAAPAGPLEVSAAQVEIAQAHAWQLLEKAFTSNKASTRNDAISALSTIPSNARVINMVESALSDKDPSVRAQAAATLAEMNVHASIPKIKPLLKDTSPEVSFEAARALSQLGDNSGRDILVEVLTGERHVSGGLVNSGVTWAKQFTAKNIAFLGAEEGATVFAGPFGAIGVSAVRQLLFDDHTSPARASSAQALAPDGSQRAIDILEKALKDKNWTVRFSAANALGFAPTQEPIPHLSNLLHDKKFAVRLVSAASIVRLASPPPPPPPAYTPVSEEQPLLPPQ